MCETHCARLTLASIAAVTPAHLEQDNTMVNITIWHNPRCSKSRVTLGLLQEKGIDPVEVKYLEKPPTVAEITAALIALKIPPFELIRRNEPAFKELKLSKESTDNELIAAMANHPILLESTRHAAFFCRIIDAY